MKRFTLVFVLSLAGLFFRCHANSTRQQPFPLIEKPAFFLVTAPKLITPPANTPLLTKPLHRNAEKYNSPLDRLLGDNPVYNNKCLIKKFSNDPLAVVCF